MIVLSLRELRRAAAAIDRQLAGARLDRIVQPDSTSVALVLYVGGDGKRILGLSADPSSARVGLLDAPPRSPDGPPPFAQYLRAHWKGARLAGAGLRGQDRQLSIRFDTGQGPAELVLSLVGHRTNLYALDARERVVAALRPLARTRADLSLGEPWRDPAPRPGGPREGEDRFAHVPEDELLAALQAAGAAKEGSGRWDELARRTRQALRKEGRRIERKLADVESDLAEADRAHEFERAGELLKSVLGDVRPGASEVVARDFETGREVAIPLDPTKSAKENLEATFKRYRKLVRRIAKAGSQVDALREQQGDHAALERELEALLERGPEALADLEARAAQPALKRLLGRYAPARGPGGAARAGARPEPAKKGPFAGLATRLVPRRYRSRDGLEIWVGRSDEGNDHLTTRLARGKDLFFHLEGAPGSHVILRTEGRDDPPSESVLDACELAVQFSKAKRASRADVHVVPIKNVRKPRGAKPGLVTVHGGKTVHLRREESRLRRLLESVIEE